jgi:hypothetical protein
MAAMSTSPVRVRLIVRDVLQLLALVTSYWPVRVPFGWGCSDTVSHTSGERPCSQPACSPFEISADVLGAVPTEIH